MDDYLRADECRNEADRLDDESDTCHLCESRRDEGYRIAGESFTVCGECSDQVRSDEDPPEVVAYYDACDDAYDCVS